MGYEEIGDLLDIRPGRHNKIDIRCFEGNDRIEQSAKMYACCVAYHFFPLRICRETIRTGILPILL